MIKTDVIGNLGMDAVVNNVNGKNVINFSLAHTEKFKDAQGVQREKVIWIKAAYWNDRTAVAQYLKKGTLVFVSGQPEIGTYQDKQGRTQAEFKLRVSQIQLLGSKNENTGGNAAQNSGSGYSNQSSVGGSDITDAMDDVPF